MSSKVELCNRALQRIGAARITSLEDNTESSKACNAIFEMIVEEILSRNDWSSARRRVELAQTLDTPAYGYEYEYQLPTDPRCLRVLSVNASPISSVNYRIEGDKLLTDETSISITYTAMLDSSGDYGPYVSRAIVGQLAAELCYAFTATQSKVDAMNGYAEKEFMEAAAADAIQGPPADLRNDDYDGSRL